MTQSRGHRSSTGSLSLGTQRTRFHGKFQWRCNARMEREASPSLCSFDCSIAFRGTAAQLVVPAARESMTSLFQCGCRISMWLPGLPLRKRNRGDDADDENNRKPEKIHGVTPWRVKKQKPRQRGDTAGTIVEYRLACGRLTAVRRIRSVRPERRPSARVRNARPKATGIIRVGQLVVYGEAARHASHEIALF